jgi:hypothetical protein
VNIILTIFNLEVFSVKRLMTSSTYFVVTIGMIMKIILSPKFRSNLLVTLFAFEALWMIVLVDCSEDFACDFLLTLNTSELTDIDCTCHAVILFILSNELRVSKGLLTLIANKAFWVIVIFIHIHYLLF